MNEVLGKPLQPLDLSLPNPPLLFLSPTPKGVLWEYKAQGALFTLTQEHLLHKAQWSNIQTEEGSRGWPALWLLQEPQEGMACA